MSLKKPEGRTLPIAGMQQPKPGALNQSCPFLLAFLLLRNPHPDKITPISVLRDFQKVCATINLNPDEYIKAKVFYIRILQKKAKTCKKID